VSKESNRANYLAGFAESTARVSQEFYAAQQKCLTGHAREVYHLIAALLHCCIAALLHCCIAA